MKILDLIPGGKGTLIVGAFAAAAYGGWWLRDLQADAAEGVRLAAQQETRDLLQELAGDVSANTEASIGKIRIENRTINQKAVHEVQTNTVYRDCRLPDAGRVLINDARAAANASIGAVPAPAATK